MATTGVIPYPEVFPLNLSSPIGREQALVIHVRDRGLVLITGCGHPGLEELIKRSEALYDLPVVGVVGGLHYGDAGSSELAGPIAYLRGKGPELVGLSPHDSETAALNAFQETFQVLEVGRLIHFS